MAASVVGRWEATCGAKSAVLGLSILRSGRPGAGVVVHDATCASSSAELGLLEAACWNSWRSFGYGGAETGVVGCHRRRTCCRQSPVVELLPGPRG